MFLLLGGFDAFEDKDLESLGWYYFVSRGGIEAGTKLFGGGIFSLSSMS